MTDAISAETYNEAVTEYATRAAAEAEEAAESGEDRDPDHALFGFVEDDVQHHNWFARSYYGGSLYGSIIEHSEADVGRYSDWQALIESRSPEKTLKRLALVCFEADVLDRARELVDGEEEVE